MKLKALVAAFATAFVMVACDSSTSAEADHKNNPSSSESKGLSSSGKSETPASSSEKGSSSSAGKANGGNSSNSASIGDIIKDIDLSNLTTEQKELFQSFQEKIGALSRDEELVKTCTDGETKTGTVMNQEVGYTCWSNMWMPTSGFDKLIENMSPEQQATVANIVGVSVEELLLIVKFFTNADLTETDMNVTCIGDVGDNSWSIAGSGTFMGDSTKMQASITFEGNTMKMVETEEMNVGDEKTCKAIVSIPDGDEEDEEDIDDEESMARLYGQKVAEEDHCEGSMMVHTENRIKENVSSDERAAVYADFVGKCKDYRDGKITFEEFID